MSGRATDWDAYYRRPFAATRITRRMTGRLLASLIRRYLPRDGPLDIVELGGANSCFFERLDAQLAPRSYHIVDSNEFGLERMRQRLRGRGHVQYHRRDVLDLRLDVRAGLVFSIGLVEHFDPGGTRRAIRAHLDLARPGGIVIISFPTPTPPYRLCRALAERLGVWAFPDERPLRAPEVEAALAPGADVLHRRILWPIILTQMFIIARKRGEGQ